MLGLPDVRRIRRVARAAAASPTRKLRQLRRARSAPPLRRESLYLTNTSGYRVHLVVTEPDDDERRPAVVLVPGRDKDSTVFDHALYVVSAPELAQTGLRVVTFDPVGRGRSWGHDDLCGSEGQDSLRAVLEYAHSRRDVLPGRIGVASFSLGLSLAAPVVAEHGERLGTAFLLDWEGPADRDAILRTGPLPPAARASLARSPEHFWEAREPLSSLEDLPCPYLRVQAREDHALGSRGVEGALRLVAEATRGRCPEARLNDNPPGVAWQPDQIEELRWAPDGPAALAELLITTLSERLGAEPGTVAP